MSRKKTNKIEAETGEVVQSNKPFIIRNGGIAKPLGYGLYLLGGKTHEQGGIDIDFTGDARIFSAQPILNGNSPAELVTRGANPNQTFIRQELFKDVNGINDDGSRKAQYGKETKEEIGIEVPGMELAKKLNLLKSTEENPITIDDMNKDVYRHGDNENVRKIDLNHLTRNDIITDIEVLDKDNYIYTIASDVNGNPVRIYHLNDHDNLPVGYSKFNNSDIKRSIINARKQLDYIGDSNSEMARFFGKTKSIINAVDSLSNVYNIDKDIFLERLSHEGLIDNLATSYNYQYDKKQQKDIGNYSLYNIISAFDQLGLDTAGEHLAKGDYNMRWKDENLGFWDEQNENEQGVVVHSVGVPNLASGLEIKAAHIEYLTNLMKKKYPNASKKELDALINAAYNLGENHKDLNEREWIIKNYEVLPWSEMINNSMNNSNKKRLGGRTKAEWGMEEGGLADTLTDIIPIIGSAKDITRLIKNPSWKQAGRTLFSVGTDVLGYKALAGLNKLARASKAGKMINKIDDVLCDITPKINNKFTDFLDNNYDVIDKVLTETGISVIGELIQQNNDMKNKENSNKKRLGGSTGLIRVQANGKDRLMFVPFTGEETKTDRKKAVFGTKNDNGEPVDYASLDHYLDVYSKKLKNYSITDPSKLTDVQAADIDWMHDRLNNTIVNPFNADTDPTISIPNGLKHQENKILLGIEQTKANPDLAEIPVGKYSDLLEHRRTDIPVTTNRQVRQQTRAALKKEGLDWINRNKDWAVPALSAIGNVGAGVASHIINKKMLSDLEYAPTPMAKRAAKLKTTININPELTALSENLARTIDATNANTASSRVANARNQAAMLNTTLTANKLYTDKENRETALINQDRLNQQEVANANIDAYNNWMATKNAFENTIREKQSENSVALADSTNKALRGVISEEEKRRQFRNNLAVMSAAYPNVTPELLRSYGIDFLRMGGKVKLNKKK